MLNGRPAAPGVAIGRAVVWLHDQDFAPARKIGEQDVEPEIQRFHLALAEARAEILALKKAVERGRKVSAEDLAIFDTQVAYLDDPVFRGDIEKGISNDRVNLEGAISASTKNFARIFELVENKIIKERASDLRDIGLRVLRHVRGDLAERPGVADTDRTVLVTDELLLSDVAQLEMAGYAGIVAEGSAERSHPVILARSLGIPIVTGIPGVLERVKNGDLLIVDGSAGSLHIDPSNEIRDEYQQIRQEFRSTLETHPEILGQENRTHDGVAIKILANIAKISDLEMTTSSNMDGVGLFRSEFDYVVSRTLPTAHRLAETYGAAAERLKDRPLNVRLLEIDTSRPFHDLKISREPNPALGQRSLRLLLRHPRLLEPLLEALLMAAPRGNLGILVPFVSSLDDLKTVTGELERIARKSGLDRSRIRMGMVLEIPSVLFQLEEILPHVDFVAIGMDNLTQYLLAADRNNSLIAEYQDRANPGVLRALAHASKVLGQSGREFYPYGDIIADPLFTPLLLGMGFRCLSMSPVAVPRVKGVLTRLDIAYCTSLAAECLACDTGVRVQEALVRARQKLLQKVPSA